ncbi:Hsp20/alpha crystallin family protein [Bacillus alveayuensis]|uniref:HSP20 family molecular chaperone IbpA n=1 Tax=Aeribacillus alveayuensis TaxID=279215 RepID=A0ABT9VKT4_9BACI|nr:Hsp20/alpha crystallin family protein [Bacillus alveayuensis]MDQ0161587.1 HSP20 family molecular chaperone IbpA [Bacillus alveayuensis]
MVEKKGSSNEEQYPDIPSNLKYLQESIDHFFNSTSIKNLFEHFEKIVSSSLPFPHVSIDSYETENEFIIKGHLPGIKKDQILIDLYERYLTVSIQHVEDVKEFDEKKKMTHYAKTMGNVSKTFLLPYPVSEEDLNASFRNEQLIITIPLKRKRIFIEE